LSLCSPTASGDRRSVSDARSKPRNTRSTIWFGVSPPGSDQHLARRSAPFDGPRCLL
jgi:hypothetical protein